jgi:hypothetical protein
MYKLLVKGKISCNFPCTEAYSEQSLRTFVEAAQPFFIKPTDSWGGKLISLITINTAGYILKKQGYPNQYFGNKENLIKYLLKDNKDKLCIIQEKAPILTANSRPFDIRTHLQRDAANTWVFAGDLLRIGGYQSIVSNVVVSNGNVLETKPFLKRLFNSETKADSIIESLEKTSFQIARMLDRYYPFIDIGSDFGMDKNGGLWLIEVNTDDVNGRPDYELFNRLPDKSIFGEMKRRDEERNHKWLVDAFEGYFGKE